MSSPEKSENYNPILFPISKEAAFEAYIYTKELVGNKGSVETQILQATSVGPNRSLYGIFLEAGLGAKGEGEHPFFLGTLYVDKAISIQSKNIGCVKPKVFEEDVTAIVKKYHLEEGLMTQELYDDYVLTKRIEAPLVEYAQKISEGRSGEFDFFFDLGFRFALMISREAAVRIENTPEPETQLPTPDFFKVLPPWRRGE